MKIDTDILKAAAKLKSITEAKQLKFAVSKAINVTAKEVQVAIKAAMPKRFILRSNWIVQGMRVEYSNKSKLEATVYSRDKFMGLQEWGGIKHPFGNYLAIPTTLVRRTPKDKIRKADTPKGLGEKATVVTVGRRKFIALKKPRKGASGNKLRLMYILIPQAGIKKRLGLQDDGKRIARSRFLQHLERELENAIKTAK